MKKTVSLVLLLMLLLCLSTAWAEEGFETWFLVDVLDDFEEPSGDVLPAYFSTKGEFTNSVISAGKAGLTMGLSYSMQVMKYGDEGRALSVKLLEYHDNLVQNDSMFSDAPVFYRISFKDKDKQKGSLKGCMLHGDSSIWLIDGFEVIDGPGPIIDALRKGGTVQFVITEEEDEETKYKFSMDAAQFGEVYDAYLTKASER